MKKMLYFVSVCSLLLTTTLFGQINKEYNGPQPEIYTGAKALIFSYTPFQSNLGSAPAGTVLGLDVTGSTILYPQMSIGGIGLKYFLSTNLSLVTSLGIGLSSTEDDILSSGSVVGTYTISTTLLALSVDMNYHLTSLYSISPYMGANINYGSISITYEDKYNQAGYTGSKDEYSQATFGLGLNVGFDWYFTDGMALGGKYTFGYTSYGQPEMSSGTTTYKGTSTSVFGTGIGSLILSVHF